MGEGKRMDGQIDFGIGLRERIVVCRLRDAWVDREKRALGEKGFEQGSQGSQRPSKPSQGGSHSRSHFEAMGFVHSAPTE